MLINTKGYSMFDWIGDTFSGLGGAVSGLFGGDTGVDTTGVNPGDFQDSGYTFGGADLTGGLGKFNPSADITKNVNLAGGIDGFNNTTPGAGSGGLGFNTDTLLKAGLLGNALYNDYFDRGAKEFVLENNATKLQNARERSSRVHESLTGKKNDMPGKDYDTTL